MGRGKNKPADSSAEEPDKPPPVAPRPGASDSAFEQEKSSKKVDKSIKKDSENLPSLPLLRVRLSHHVLWRTLCDVQPRRPRRTRVVG
jgi:hypothetical protein